MPAKLLITHPGVERPAEHDLVHDETTIGRSPLRNEVVLADDRVSRHHAVIRRVGSTFILEDLSSVNGTCVNGARVTEHVLADGDVVSIGRCSLAFNAERRSASVHYEDKKLSGTVLVRSLEQIGLSRRLSEAGDRCELEDIGTLRKRAETLARFYELGQVLSSEFSLETIFRKLSEMLFRVTPADRCAVLLKDVKTGNLIPFTTESRNPATQKLAGAMAISTTVLERVLTERIALLSVDAQADSRLEGSASILVQRVHSVMCAPLLRRDEVLGVIYTDCREAGRIFAPEDLDMMNALAAQAAMAVDNAMTHDQLVKEAVARAAYGRFMPRHVVEQILADPSALSLGGANQVVTIHYTDIRGFTTIAENLPPETVLRMLNEYFGDMTPIVFEHGGLLDKYIGDGLMALFGVPYPSADAAEKAVSAAITMQRQVVRLSEELTAAGLPELRIGVGLNTGT
ncbi:MAG TPA: FHA domain-containing protein, partial [Blastocatellia bacterium]|nr:FHA domain-containing protein [Blastocatellia bacterium]